MAHLLRSDGWLLHPEPTQYVSLLPGEFEPGASGAGHFFIKRFLSVERLNRVVSPQDAI